MNGTGAVSRRLRDELARLEPGLASGGFLVSAVDVVDEGTWGRLDAAVEGQSSGGKIQIHLSSKGSVSVVPQGAAAAGIAGALGLPVRARAAAMAAVSASTAPRAAASRGAGTSQPRASPGAATSAGNATSTGRPAPAVRPSPSTPSAPPDPRAPVIVDCSKFGKHLIGPTEWRGVQRSANGGFVEVFHSGRYARGHNNLGEFLAIVDACERIADGRLACSGIRSDSRTAISWFTKRVIKTTLDVDAVCDPDFAAEVRRAQAWLASPARQACTVRLTLWDTKREGENPADFGRK